MTKTLKQKVRDTLIARNTLERMGASVHYRNAQGQKYLNEIAVDVMKVAKRAHPIMPYYLATRRI